MFQNYIKIAFRNILKNKLYAVINILGLSMGLALYVFGGLLSDYEHSHDTMYKNHDRTYTLRTEFNPNRGIGLIQAPIIYSAVAPIVKTELPEIDAIARIKMRELIVTYKENNLFQFVRFVDPDLLKIFDFNYIHGDASALDNATNIVITETIANKFFGDENPIGKQLIISREYNLQVGAVIQDPPANSHFSSNINGNKLEILVPISLMQTITGFNPDTNWGLLNGSDLTYVMLPNDLNIDWLQAQIDGIYDRHYSTDRREVVSRVLVYPLIDANLSTWNSYDVPAIEIIETLGYLVLLIACINYTNLATAQSMGRIREIGLRKTLGAGRIQLLIQFITESITITIFAMIVTLTSLEILIPLFNSATGKILSLNYLALLPWITIVTLTVGIFSGAYPAYLITKINPIESLKTGIRNGRSANWIRGGMIGIQFTISVFMLALLLVVFAQNKNIIESSNIFAKDHIYVLDRLDLEDIEIHHETLRNEIETIPEVERFSLSSQVPFEGRSNGIRASTSSTDFTSIFSINEMIIDYNYLSTYNIPLVAGRNLTKEAALDNYSGLDAPTNVIVNEMAAYRLGYSSPQDALGQTFYENDTTGDDSGLYTYTIVGVVKDQNIYGLQNDIKPFVFYMNANGYSHGSVKLSNRATPETIRDIEKAWKRVIPEYPLQARFLDDWFQETYQLFDLSAKTLAGFAVFSLILALIGLFGLSAFMAEQRTKEIGIRKVLGANTNQIITLMIWQFSKPVIWATPFALAFAYLASNTYLEFFDDRINLPFGLLIIAGFSGLLLSWLTVATHALSIAKTNPVYALHYE